MKEMKAKELLAKKDEDLVKKLAELTDRSALLKVEIATKKAKSFDQAGGLRREIARIKTVLRERALLESAKKTAAAATAAAPVKEAPDA